jgi:ATP-binding cassette subfamily F protein 3
LKQHNVLVLDEPGNHLDVESVEALADALTRYRGTVIFTSHDRHFMHRVATHVIEVRTGRVASYPASFDDYVYRVQNEIDKGHREPHTAASPGKPTSAHADTAGGARKSSGKSDRESQKKLKSVERKIAKLDEEKKATSEALLTVTDAAEARRLHSQLKDLAAELASLEEQWLELSAELDGV